MYIQCRLTKPKALYIKKKEKTKKQKAQNKLEKKKKKKWAHETKALLSQQCLHSANTLSAQCRSTVAA